MTIGNTVGAGKKNEPYEEPRNNNHIKAVNKRVSTNQESAQYKNGKLNNQYVSPNMQSCKALYGEP